MRRALLAFAALALWACSNPPVQTAADRVNSPVTTTLSGELIFQGNARGDAIIFLYDAAHPPPPTGTSHPLAFVQIPASALFGAQAGSGAGPFAAPFTFSQVQPGTYLVAAALDSDGCLVNPGASCHGSDFDPFFAVTREPNSGDLLGGHVDATGLALAPVVIPEPDGQGHLGPVAGINVILGERPDLPAQVPFGKPLPDRPAFTVAIDSALRTDTGAKLNKGEPTFFHLQASPQNSGTVSESNPVFLVRYVDDNHDGVPDRSAQGIPLLWPKVFVRKIAEPDPAHPSSAVAAGLRDENDLDDNGVLDATGKSYDRVVNGQLVPADGEPALVVLAATYAADPVTDPQQAAIPSQLYAQLAYPDGGADVTKVLPQTSLPLVVFPQAFDARDSAHPVPLSALPAGRYAVVVEQFTGQTWRLPNELSPAVAAALGFTASAEQGFTFTVAP